MHVNSLLAVVADVVTVRSNKSSSPQTDIAAAAATTTTSQSPNFDCLPEGKACSGSRPGSVGGAATDTRFIDFRDLGIDSTHIHLESLFGVFHSASNDYRVINIFSGARVESRSISLSPTKDLRKGETRRARAEAVCDRTAGCEREGGMGLGEKPVPAGETAPVGGAGGMWIVRKQTC